MVKRVIIYIALLFPVLFVQAQNVPVAAIVDNRSVDLNHIAKSLNSKLDNAIVTAGVHSENERGLYLVGTLIPNGEDVVDTGMKKLTVRTYTLSLRIEQPLLDIRFGSIEIPLEGSGKSSIQASMDAVRKFNPSASDVQNFIKSSINNADIYFVDNINNIIDKANMLAKSGDYEAGIALLWGCPNIPTIHTNVYEALGNLYEAMQKNDCSTLLACARSAYSLKQYEKAAILLSDIKPESVCIEEAKALSSKIAQEIRQEEKDLRILDENERERQAKLEAKRISAVENIANAYLSNHKTTYHYHIWY